MYLVLLRRKVEFIQVQIILNIQGKFKNLVVLVLVLCLYFDFIFYGCIIVLLYSLRIFGVSIYMYWIKIQIEYYKKYMRGFFVIIGFKDLSLQCQKLSLFLFVFFYEVVFGVKWIRIGFYFLFYWFYIIEWRELVGQIVVGMQGERFGW